MYNEFAPKHYKGKCPCTTKTLYNEKTLTGRLHKYFLIYFETFSAPTADTLFLLVLSILTLESVHSIRFLYQHFLSGITTKSLNTFFHACSYAKVDYSHFMNITAKVLGAMLVCTIIWYRTQYMNYIILGIAEFMLVGVLAAGAFVLALVSEVRDCVGKFIIGG